MGNMPKYLLEKKLWKWAKITEREIPQDMLKNKLQEVKSHLISENYD